MNQPVHCARNYP